jgi:putative DNA methylase
MQPSSNQTDSQTNLRYIEKGIEAKGHTPIYKMHRYFARRPHNVFKYLIEFYTKPGDLILDCFCGGGVTLFEGLALGRKVVAVDINPLATFITDCQATPVSIQEYRRVLAEVWDSLHQLTKRFYSTECRRCHRTADVRWFELAYRVKCKECGKETLLSNQNKAQDRGSSGRYVCQNCGSKFSSVDAERKGYALVSVTYRCRCVKGRQKAAPSESDIGLMTGFERDFDRLLKEYDLWYPKDKIPAGWDRQLEDGLNRKSVSSFSDLFTRRGLFLNAYLLKCINRYKNRVSPELYKFLVFTFSAIIRHTNSMTFSASSWMDGRPISWDKHAYWIPNQFVEVNPLEYLEKRRNAFVSGLRFQQSKLKNVKRTEDFSSLERGEGSHVIWTRSSENLPIPDETVDAIITDPPYGSNVQYGELSYYWLVWLRHELDLPKELVHFDREIVVHRRKQTSDRKDYDFYSDALRRVFSEGFRVLKPSGVLVFTFNNKDLRAWYAVVKAAVRSGFHVDERGIVYQQPIEKYMNTSHTRFAGALHGDFICTFYKAGTAKRRGVLDKHVWTKEQIVESVLTTCKSYLSEHIRASTNELYTTMISKITPILAEVATSDTEFSRLGSVLETDYLKRLLERSFVWDRSEKVWRLRGPPAAKDEG